MNTTTTIVVTRDLDPAQLVGRTFRTRRLVRGELFVWTVYFEQAWHSPTNLWLGALATIDHGYRQERTALALDYETTELTPC